MEGFDDAAWKPAVVAVAPAIAVSSQITAPARVIATLIPKSVTPVTNGAYIFDIGQNMVGWTTLKVRGATGTRVRLRYAEILNPDGTIYTAIFEMRMPRTSIPCVAGTKRPLSPILPSMVSATSRSLAIPERRLSMPSREMS